MRNVSDAGVKALAEAGCGSGLRTIILGAVWQCPFSSNCGVMDCGFGTVTCCSLVVFDWRFCCCYCLATKCPRCHELGDDCNCVM